MPKNDVGQDEITVAGDETISTVSSSGESAAKAPSDWQPVSEGTRDMHLEEEIPSAAPSSSEQPSASAESVPPKRRVAGWYHSRNIGVLGFSSSGKTVFLSMLYHMTAERRGFQGAWQVDWSRGDDGETARYLRDVGHSILGLDDNGVPRYADAARTKLIREFPPGTKSMRELRFELSRQWGLTDFPIMVRTLEYSGEAIENAAKLGVEKLQAAHRDQWEEVAGVCSNSDAILLFVNILNIDHVQDSGELLMLMQAILKRKRKIRALSVVVAGADVLDGQNEIDRNRDIVEEKYGSVFSLLDQHGIHYDVFMVSNIGRKMVRKRTVGLASGCMGADHLCPHCQELVDDPKVQVNPINMLEPIEFAFKHLLPWYLRWEPMAICHGVFSYIRRAIFNRFVFPLLAISGLGGGAYWYTDYQSSMTDQIHALSEDASVDAATEVAGLLERYEQLYFWDDKGIGDLHSVTEAHMAHLHTQERVASDTNSIAEKIAALDVFIHEFKTSLYANEAKVQRVSLMCDADISAMWRETEIPARLSKATQALVHWKGNLGQRVEKEAIKLLDYIRKSEETSLRNTMSQPSPVAFQGLVARYEGYAECVGEWPIARRAKDEFLAWTDDVERRASDAWIEAEKERYEHIVSRLEDDVDSVIASVDRVSVDRMVSELDAFENETVSVTRDPVRREEMETFVNSSRDRLRTTLFEHELAEARRLLEKAEIAAAAQLMSVWIDVLPWGTNAACRGICKIGVVEKRMNSHVVREEWSAARETVGEMATVTNVLPEVIGIVSAGRQQIDMGEQMAVCRSTRKDAQRALDGLNSVLAAVDDSLMEMHATDEWQDATLTSERINKDSALKLDMSVLDSAHDTRADDYQRKAEELRLFQGSIREHTELVRAIRKRAAAERQLVDLMSKYAERRGATEILGAAKYVPDEWRALSGPIDKSLSHQELCQVYESRIEGLKGISAKIASAEIAEQDLRDKYDDAKKEYETTRAEVSDEDLRETYGLFGRRTKFRDALRLAEQAESCGQESTGLTSRWAESP